MRLTLHIDLLFSCWTVRALLSNGNCLVCMRAAPAPFPSATFLFRPALAGLGHDGSAWSGTSHDSQMRRLHSDSATHTSLCSATHGRKLKRQHLFWQWSSLLSPVFFFSGKRGGQETTKTVFQCFNQVPKTPKVKSTAHRWAGSEPPTISNKHLLKLNVTGLQISIPCLLRCLFILKSK